MLKRLLPRLQCVQNLTLRIKDNKGHFPKSQMLTANLQWNPSTVDTIGTEILSFISYLRGLICTKRVHLGFSEVVFIEGCPHVRGGL